MPDVDIPVPQLPRIEARRHGLPTGPPDWESLVREQDGVVSRPQALRFIAAKALHARVVSGRWQVVHRGIYAVHNGPLTGRQRLWAASLSVGAGRPALLGGLTALTVLGLRQLASPSIHVLLPDERRDRNPPPGILVHRTRRLPATDVRPHPGPPCTKAARSVVDAARWARTDVEARTVIVVAYQQGLVVRDEVEQTAARLPVLYRRALILRTAADARGGAVTLSELDLVRLCRRNRLPVPDRQVFRHDASGQRRYLDAMFERWGIAVEVDGAHQPSADQWWRDMVRHNDLSLRGEVVLRFPAWRVREFPDDVADTLRRALLKAGWRP